MEAVRHATGTTAGAGADRIGNRHRSLRRMGRRRCHPRGRHRQCADRFRPGGQSRKCAGGTGAHTGQRGDGGARRASPPAGCPPSRAGRSCRACRGRPRTRRPPPRRCGRAARDGSGVDRRVGGGRQTRIRTAGGHATTGPRQYGLRRHAGRRRAGRRRRHRHRPRHRNRPHLGVDVGHPGSADAADAQDG